MTFVSRRQVAWLLASTAAMSLPSSLFAQAALPQVAVTKDPDCGCCNGWVAHLRRSGFPVSVTDDPDVASLKAKLKIPDDLSACHTAEVAGYIVEGHVPAPAILRLLKEKPAARGIAVPGMPAGSPGMGAETHEVYEVTLFGDAGRSSYGKFKGDKPV